MENSFLRFISLAIFLQFSSKESEQKQWTDHLYQTRDSVQSEQLLCQCPRALPILLRVHPSSQRRSCPSISCRRSHQSSPVVLSDPSSLRDGRGVPPAALVMMQPLRFWGGLGRFVFLRNIGLSVHQQLLHSLNAHISITTLMLVETIYVSSCTSFLDFFHCQRPTEAQWAVGQSAANKLTQGGLLHNDSIMGGRCADYALAF